MRNENSVLITDETGVVVELIAEKDAGDDIETFDGILSPGFINCHCHLELSHLKGLFPEKTGLVDFVTNVITRRNVDETYIAEAIKRAEDEMLKNGIIAIGDICNNALTFSQKQSGRLLYHNFIEVTGWNPQVANARFTAAKDLEKLFKQVSEGVSLSPHAPYSVSDELWQLLQPEFSNQVVTIHNQETLAEEELFVAGTGKFVDFYHNLNILNSTFKHGGRNSIYSSFPYLMNAESALLVHNTFINEADIDYIQANHNNVNFCLCPNANIYIEDSLPPVKMMMEKDCNIVLGTDSLASNHQLSILSEMETLAKSFPFLSQTQLLQWGTLNGAKALQIDDHLGSFEKGKKPGVLIINPDFSSVKRIV